mmetsp:Transcript_167531/g.537972  ORF Transcript_167531/g.537972 Transcript_167531/m.537972 type:complete len:225 (+) Transcript_167531:1471-2145(+)
MRWRPDFPPSSSSSSSLKALKLPSEPLEGWLVEDVAPPATAPPAACMLLNGPGLGRAPPAAPPPPLKAQGATPVAVSGGCLPPALPPPPPPMAHGATPVAVSGGFAPPPPLAPPPPAPPAPGGFQPPRQYFSELTSCGLSPAFSSSASAPAASAAAACAALAAKYAGRGRPGPQRSSAAERKTSGSLASNFSSTRVVIRFTVGFQNGSPPRSKAGSRVGINSAG